MRKLSLRVLQRQLEVRAQVPQPLQPVVQRAAAQQEQVQRARGQRELVQQRVRPALLEPSQARSQPLAQLLQALAWLV